MKADRSMRNLCSHITKVIIGLLMQFWMCAPASAGAMESLGQTASNLLSGTPGILLTLILILFSIISAANDSLASQRWPLLFLSTAIMVNAMPSFKDSFGAHVAGVSILLFISAVVATLLSDWNEIKRQTSTNEQRVDDNISIPSSLKNFVPSIPEIPELEQHDAREASTNEEDPRPERNKRKIVL